MLAPPFPPSLPYLPHPTPLPLPPGPPKGGEKLVTPVPAEILLPPWLNITRFYRLTQQTLSLSYPDHEY